MEALNCHSWIQPHCLYKGHCDDIQHALREGECKLAPPQGMWRRRRLLSHAPLGTMCCDHSPHRGREGRYSRAEHWRAEETGWDTLVCLHEWTKGMRPPLWTLAFAERTDAHSVQSARAGAHLEDSGRSGLGTRGTATELFYLQKIAHLLIRTQIPLATGWPGACP